MNAVEDRLYRFHRKNAVTGCWIWTRFVDPVTGYGQGTNARGKTRGVHRLAYETWVGQIPKGKLVCHTCDNRRCINPAHLFLGTHGDNYQDAKTKGRNTRGESHGMHKLTEDEVKEIFKRLAAGEPDQRIANDYEVNTISIWRIRHRKTWKHLEAPKFAPRPKGNASHVR